MFHSAKKVDCVLDGLNSKRTAAGDSIIADMEAVQREIRRLVDRSNQTETSRASADHSPAFAHEVIDRICVAQNIPEFTTTKKFRCIRPQLVSKHDSMCAVCTVYGDFGPPSIECISNFIELLDHELSAHPSCKIVLCIDDGRRALTRAVFLLGTFMVLKHDTPADEVFLRFSWLRSSSLESFRHVSASLPGIPLSPLDCWRALERARALGWVHDPGSRPALHAVAAATTTTHAAVEESSGVKPSSDSARAGLCGNLCLMRRHGFAAREAIGWLGIVRPCPAAGRARHSLCSVERPRRRLGAFIPGTAYRGGGGSAVAG
jgi:hypothetical protein